MGKARKRTHGAGTIVRRPNGRYTAQYTDERTGRRLSAGTFDTRRQAERAIAEAVVGPAAPGDGEQLTLGAYLTAWVEAQRAYRKATTTDGYRMKVAAYVLPHPIAEVRLGRLRPGDLRRHYAMLAERGGRGGRPLGDHSVAGVDRMVRAAINAAVRDGVIARSPLPPERVRVARREAPWASPEHLRRLLVLVRLLDADLEVAVRLGALYGWRRSEIAGLRWADVDLASRVVRIRGTRVVTSAGRAVASDGKTPGARATVPIDAGTAAALEAHRERRRELLEADVPAGECVYASPFGEPLYPDTLTERFRRLVVAYNVTHSEAPLPPRFTLQSLRHSFASAMIAAGESTLVVAAAMRHTSPRMVEQTYGHLAPSTVAEAVGRLAAAVAEPFDTNRRAHVASSPNTPSRESAER
jgi:integrase